MCISRATVSAVSCLVVPAFICIDLLISLVLKINDDDDDEYTSVASVFHCRRGLTNLIHDFMTVVVVHVRGSLSSVDTSACLFHAGANGRVS